MTVIKICGITRAEDAAAAVSLGANALGFILWPNSPRSVALSDASRIIEGVPASVDRVAVFVNPSEGDLIDAKRAGFSVAQIHQRRPRRVPDGLRVMQAVRLSADGEGIDPDVDENETVLLDAHDPVLHGGTGRTVDWTKARVIAAKRRVFLAGGLTAENVSEAIRVVRPFAVDVASGVEARPGVKDHHKLKAFIQAVKETAP